jgi:DNA helicase-2/ATP-dependent DNA helicase PcrA
MEIIADLQVHSKYARAVSKFSDLHGNFIWAKKKGIHLIGTGDFQHPEYFKEIKRDLVEVNNGIYQLKDNIGETLPKFMLQSEISSIYKQGGKSRRVHNLIFSPSIESSEKLIKELEKKGANLRADGRPIIGISSHDLLDLMLNIDENMMMIPAHVWTPWFGLLGSKSGFDSIEECFGDLSKYIYAIETGMSSDPRMNWQIKEFENRSIVSFSDAHSGQKLGREATVFRWKTDIRFQISDFSYFDIVDAIKQNKNSKLEIAYTIEFFPEEGKYHLSGHRSHNLRLTTKEVEKVKGICPVCGKPLTIGVEDRVASLSNKLITNDKLQVTINDVGLTTLSYQDRPGFVSMIPLQEILYEVSNPKAGAVRDYEMLVSQATEFDILLKLNYGEIENLGGLKLAEAIKLVRNRKVQIDPGYDGVFGKVKVFE